MKKVLDSRMEFCNFLLLKKLKRKSERNILEKGKESESLLLIICRIQSKLSNSSSASYHSLMTLKITKLSYTYSLRFM